MSIITSKHKAMYLDLKHEIHSLSEHILYLADEWDKTKIEHERVYYLDRIARLKIRLNLKEGLLETIKKMIVEEIYEQI